MSRTHLCDGGTRITYCGVLLIRAGNKFYRKRSKKKSRHRRSHPLQTINITSSLTTTDCKICLRVNGAAYDARQHR